MAKFTKKQIDRWLSQYKTSGQRLAVFCSDKPFSKATLYNWLRKHDSNSDEAPTPSSSFIQIQGPGSSVPTPKAVIHLTNGIEIQLYDPICDAILHKLAHIRP